jgi:excisionase family DNA binding protein
MQISKINIDPVLRLRDACELLNLSAASVRRLIHDGALRATRYGKNGKFRLRKSWIEALIQEGSKNVPLG